MPMAMFCMFITFWQMFMHSARAFIYILFYYLKHKLKGIKLIIRLTLSEKIYGIISSANERDI